MKAAIFLRNSYHITEGETPEECLSKMREYYCLEVLTYRPCDGAIYNYSHIPCGIIFREGYQAPLMGQSIDNESIHG